MAVAAIVSYTDKLALRWVEKFITVWAKNNNGDRNSDELRGALITEFPGKISNIVFSDSITPGRLTFLYWHIDQNKARYYLTS